MCNRGTFSALRALVKKQNPQCVFLMETKRDSARMEKVARRLGYDKWEVDEAQGNA